MKKIAAAIACVLLAATPARADDRLLDGALGGLAGAVALGPLGLVGGALIGATAGPGISSSWGLDHGHRGHRRRRRR